jgi:lantibiotic modifying enzyme
MPILCHHHGGGLLWLDRDERYDLVSGSAGAILGLLQLHSVTESSASLSLARDVADRLIARRPENLPIWVSTVFDKEPLTGISHGASGFALAFARLRAVTGVEKYAIVAEECASFERRHFDREHHNWCDTRPARMRRGERHGNQWCYGGAGVGYARLEMVRYLSGRKSEGDLRRDLEYSIHGVMTVTHATNDTLCCGTAGQVDFLGAAAEALQAAAIAEVATRRMSQVKERWFATGDCLWDQGSAEFNLGLMRGLAGVGYAALRLEHPNAPRVLLLA